MDGRTADQSIISARKIVDSLRTEERRLYMLWERSSTNVTDAEAQLRTVIKLARAGTPPKAVDEQVLHARD